MAKPRTLDPYVVGLQCLARRELSAAQLRERLRTRAFPEDRIEPAIARLRDEQALDDRRAARARARAAVLVKLRGRSRAVKEIEALGIDRESARAAVDDVFAEVDETTILERALARRLHGRVQDRPHFRRLYQYLLRQGFPPPMVAAALKARSKVSFVPDED